MTGMMDMVGTKETELHPYPYLVQRVPLHYTSMPVPLKNKSEV